MVRHNGGTPPRPWKWRTRSGRSTGDTDNPGGGPSSLPLSSPTVAMLRSDFPSVPVQTPASVAGTFLSESAHVLSLQNPASSDLSTGLGNDSQVELLRMSNREDEFSKHIPEPIIIPTSPVRARSSSGPARKLYLKTIKGIEARLKGKTIRDVRSP